MTADTMPHVRLPIARKELVGAFRAVGVKPGDSLLVHSSFRALRPVEGGPEAVIDALLEAIGPGGNLMLPTFTYTRPIPEPHFDPDQTPCRTGIIPELGRRRSGAIRSLHPAHSVAVIGPQAETLTRDHLGFRSLGVGSPIDRLAQTGGKVMLVGVGHTSNSLIHIAEEHAEIPKTSWYDELPTFKIRMPDGRIVRHLLDTSPSCSAAFGGAEYALRKNNEIADIQLGGCKIQLMRGADVLRRVLAILEDKPDVLLCTWPGCKPCVGARRQLRQQGRL